MSVMIYHDSYDVVYFIYLYFIEMCVLTLFVYRSSFLSLVCDGLMYRGRARANRGRIEHVSVTMSVESSKAFTARLR